MITYAWQIKKEIDKNKLAPKINMEQVTYHEEKREGSNVIVTYFFLDSSSISIRYTKKFDEVISIEPKNPL